MTMRVSNKYCPDCPTKSTYSSFWFWCSDLATPFSDCCCDNIHLCIKILRGQYVQRNNSFSQLVEWNYRFANSIIALHFMRGAGGWSRVERYVAKLIVKWNGAQQLLTLCGNREYHTVMPARCNNHPFNGITARKF